MIWNMEQPIMRTVLLCCLLFIISLPSRAAEETTLKIEELTTAEVGELTNLRQALERAQSNLTAVQDRLKRKYGDTRCWYGPCTILSICAQTEVNVQLESKYVLIRRRVWNACVGDTLRELQGTDLDSTGIISFDSIGKIRIVR